MRWQRFWLYLAVVLSLAVAGLPAQPVVAQDPPPPVPAGRLEAPPTLAPARPAAGQAVLYDQMNSASGNFISSNSTNDQYNTRAADDFFVNPGSNSWQITAVEVAGFFLPVSGGNANQVNVAFYVSAGGRPGYSVYSANVQPISGTASSGNFYLPLNPAVYLASNANYWVSVQAVKSTSSYWYWSERSAQSQNPAVWKNPSGVFVAGCVDWTAINVCYPSTGPDLLFRLYGATSSHRVPPPIFLPLIRR